MITLEEFLEIFKNTQFSNEQLIKFYQSVNWSLSLLYAGKRALRLLLKLDKKIQWPLLEKIDDPQLEIYKEADPGLVDRFIELIRKQRQTKSHSEKEEILCQRIKLYEDIFDFSEEEIRTCQRIGEEFEKILREKRKKEQLKVGVGALAGATLGVTAAGIYFWRKNKKQGKEEPKK